MRVEGRGHDRHQHGGVPWSVQAGSTRHAPDDFVIADFKLYHEMKDSGVEGLGEVPTHWDVRQLARIGRFFKGSGGTKDERTVFRASVTGTFTRSTGSSSSEAGHAFLVHSPRHTRLPDTGTSFSLDQARRLRESGSQRSI